MKQQADKKLSKRVFTMGDCVFLKLQPYSQTSLALRRSLKLSAKYYGSFQIIAKVGSVAYKLQLPPTSTIHLIFHVFLLKKQPETSVIPLQELPVTSHDQFLVTPEQLLKQRTILRNGQRVLQGLIKWINLPIEDATWEDKAFISAQ
ncbi:hypothetical protein MANES_17G019650v8 [Manihot esculenta]|uniref:Uncharacterized protein n=1 Tax=Manihot esculenta TaxID=3983 RepID=A0ACB7G2B7_MANES|nr:hypothetical protein MANES_17G019650v8 [Manihot esculenta]